MRLRNLLAMIVLFCAPLATGVGATTFHGEFWNATAPVTNLAQAGAVIAGGGPTATFQSTRIDYPGGPATVRPDSTTLASYLGADAATLSGAGSTTLTYSVFRFTGFLDLVGGSALFSISSDDGFRLTVGGIVIAAFNGTRGFARTNVTRTMAAGRTAVELLYFENAGNTGVELRVNNLLAVPAAIPLPASLPLVLAGLGALGLLGWRRRLRAA